MSDVSAEQTSMLFFRALPLIKKIFLHSGSTSCGTLPHHLYSTLLCVHYQGTQKMSDISGILGLSKPLVTQHVERLVSGGYFKRVNDPNDRRIVLIDITAKGSAYAKKVVSHFLKKGETALKTLSPKDLKRFEESMRTLYELLSLIDTTLYKKRSGS